ncbi:hypothetical protein T636_A1420 [Enterobacter hormaechei subsp. xiangfangensis]|nr:hypothetical protein T636_A1420 [Enterobacter hormaechei subsp. xiangfangensis]
MGSVYVEGHALEAAQQALSEAITACQQSGMRTLVFGGMGRLSERSLRDHLDAPSIYARLNGHAAVRQLAHYCASQSRVPPAWGKPCGEYSGAVGGS